MPSLKIARFNWQERFPSLVLQIICIFFKGISNRKINPCSRNVSCIDGLKLIFIKHPSYDSTRSSSRKHKIYFQFGWYKNILTLKIVQSSSYLPEKYVGFRSVRNTDPNLGLIVSLSSIRRAFSSCFHLSRTRRHAWPARYKEHFRCLCVGLVWEVLQGFIHKRRWRIFSRSMWGRIWWMTNFK